jgi:hypothetical protein
MGLTYARMNLLLNNTGRARRASAALLCLALLALGVASSRAYSPAPFAAIRAQLTNDIAILGALENPTRADRQFLRAANRGSNVLTKITRTDGKTLRSLNSILGRRESYIPTINAIGSNLLTGFNAELAFVENLMLEMPDSPAATDAQAQFLLFEATGAKLNTTTNLARFAGRYDAAKRRLDDILIQASQALIVPFPADLLENSVYARINGISLKASQGSATDNVFEAVATETNVSLTVGGLAGNGINSARGILFSIPNAPFGTYRYPIPLTAVFTNRTGVYSPEESNVAATNGAIFINTTATEVYGSFSCSGPGFNITDGKFRITISSQP